MGSNFIATYDIVKSEKCLVWCTAKALRTTNSKSSQTSAKIWQVLTLWKIICSSTSKIKCKHCYIPNSITIMALTASNSYLLAAASAAAASALSRSFWRKPSGGGMSRSISDGGGAMATLDPTNQQKFKKNNQTTEWSNLASTEATWCHRREK